MRSTSARSRAAHACQDLADQVTSLFQLRHCGRKLVIRDHPSLYGQMGRCVSPCLGDLDPNAYRRRLDEALGLFDGPDGPERLLAKLDEEMERAVGRAALRARRRPARPARADRRAALAASAAWCARSTPARARCSRSIRSSRNGTSSGSRAAASPNGAPLSDQLPALETEAERLACSPANPPVVKPDEIHEVHIVSSWLAGDEAWECELEPGADVAGWVEQVVAA